MELFPLPTPFLLATLFFQSLESKNLEIALVLFHTPSPIHEQILTTLHSKCAMNSFIPSKATALVPETTMSCPDYCNSFLTGPCSVLATLVCSPHSAPGVLGQ